MGVISRRRVWLVGVGGIYGCGSRMWVESMGVVHTHLIMYTLDNFPY